jgi:hypothetical protein
MDWTKTKVEFAPWCGKVYQKGISGQRVLILGESHYHSCEKDPNCTDEAGRNIRHRNLTHDMVDHWKDHSHSSPVSHRIPELFGMSKAEFWESVAFYNYLQTFAGSGARERPNDDQWNEDSASAFQTVLDHLQPDRIMVLGKATWTNLPSSLTTLFAAPIPDDRLHIQNGIGFRNEADSVAYWYSSSSGKLALAMPIMHPSAVSFSGSDWKAYVDSWLKLNSPPIAG